MLFYLSVPVLAVLGRLGAAAGRVGVQHGGASAAHQGGERVLPPGARDAPGLECLVSGPTMAASWPPAAGQDASYLAPGHLHTYMCEGPFCVFVSF